MPDMNLIKSREGLIISRIWLLTVLLCVMTLVGSIDVTAQVVSGADVKKPVIILVSKLSKSKAKVGEFVDCRLTLYSSTNDISQCRLISNPDIPDGINVRDIGDNGEWRKEKFKGKELWAIDVACYEIICQKTGSYKIGGWQYQVSVSYPVVTRNPFYGDVINYRNIPFVETSTEVTLKVNELPGKYVGLPVGNFSIEASVPPGYIKPGASATAFITLEGTGIMPDVEYLDLGAAFEKAGLTLESTTPVLRQYMKNGERISELEIECQFIAPESGKYILPAIRMRYYDVNSDKAAECISEEVEFEAGKITGNTEPHIIQEI